LGDAGIVKAATEGTILGTVRDASGAVVANAEVTVRNEGTNLSRQVSSDAQGDYVVVDLPPAMYTISVEVPGFKKGIYSGLTLRVEQKLRVDVVLQVGEVAETVKVEGQAPLVETDSSSLGQVIDRDSVNRLPLNGRLFLQLGLLSPGTNTGSPGNRQAGNNYGNVSIAANGARSSSNNFLIDGIDNNGGWNGYYSLSPSIDAVQEFKVQTNSYSAEFGRTAGAQLNVVTRAGTNQFHGALFEFLRNAKLDANAFFSNAAGITQRPDFKRNQFGAVLGGPVFKDKTFFFFNYEGTRVRRALTRVSDVPTAAMRVGDFSGLPQIYDPLNVVQGIRQPFPNNRIPDDRVSPASKFLQNLVPAPNGPGLSRNFTRNAPFKDDVNQYGLRIDHKVGSKGQLFGRFLVAPRDVINPSFFGTPAIGAGSFGSGVTEINRPQIYGLGYEPD
jgi:hypothetical protein